MPRALPLPGSKVTLKGWVTPCTGLRTSTHTETPLVSVPVYVGEEKPIIYCTWNSVRELTNYLAKVYETVEQRNGLLMLSTLQSAHYQRYSPCTIRDTNISGVFVLSTLHP